MVACTIVHNEARGKWDGTVIKGVKVSEPYAGRMRNSTVFEDAADWIVGCAHAEGSTTTTITAGEKTRREIPTETLIIDLDADGHGTPSTGGGGADPFTIVTPVDPLDGPLIGYLMRRPEGATQNAVLKAVRGARVARLVARLKVVGTLGPDKLWRRANNTPSPPPKQVIPESQPGGGESGIGGGGSGDSRQWESGRNQYGNRFPPYRGITSGNRFPESPTGTGSLGPCRYRKYPSTHPHGGVVIHPGAGVGGTGER